MICRLPCQPDWLKTGPGYMRHPNCPARVGRTAGKPRVGAVSDWLWRKDSNLRSPDPESGALPLGHSPVDEPDSCSGPARAGPHMFGFPGSQVPIPEGSQVPTRETERIRCPRVSGSVWGLYPGCHSRANWPRR